MTDAIIDCDVHLPPASPKTMLRYMPSHWTDYFAGGDGWHGTANQLSAVYPPNAPTTSRPDVRDMLKGGPGIVLVGVPENDSAESDAPRGPSYHDLLKKEVLDRPGVERAIGNCYTALEALRHPFLAPDIASALNDYVAEEWLAAEPRLLGSVTVTAQFPDAAADEIRRVGKNDRFVQVLLPVRSVEPYGSRRYWPMFRAAAEQDLVVALHFGGLAGMPPTSSGWPSYYLEEYVGMAQVFQTQVNSIVLSGLFEEHPNLKVSLCEGGFSWMPTVMWQVDKRWKGLRRDVPWVRRPPSDYIRERMRATIQPADLPPSGTELEHLIDFIGTDEFLMYSSDFPHVHATKPEELIDLLPAAMRPKVLSGNARAFFPRLSLVAA